MRDTLRNLLALENLSYLLFQELVSPLAKVNDLGFRNAPCYNCILSPALG